MLPDVSIVDTGAEELFARHSIAYGTPTEVTETLANDRALDLATDLLIQVQPGFPTFAQSVSALETIATEVAPALGWHPATCG
jgi:hypothetical protein